MFGCAFLVLLLVQLASVAGNQWFSRLPKPQGDGPDYENIAFHLSIGEGFRFNNSAPQWRAAYENAADKNAGEDYAAQLDAPRRDFLATGRPPLYPLMVAAVYRCCGRNEFGFATVRVVSAICLALAGAIAVAMASKLAEGIRGESHRQLFVVIAATTTLVLAACHRTLQSYAMDFLTEPLALVLLQGFVWIVAFSDSPPKSGTTLGSKLGTGFPIVFGGILLGGLILTRSVFVLWLPGIFLLALFTSADSWRARTWRATVLVAVACVCCSPWWIRNCVVLNRAMPLGTQGPITLLGGYSSEAVEAHGDWQFAPEQTLRTELASSPAFQQLSSDSVREVQVADIASERVWRWIRLNVRNLPGLFWSRAVTHWNPYSGSSLLWKLLIVAGVLSLLRRSKSASDIRVFWLIGLPLISTAVTMALYSVGGRFLVPLYGVLFALAGIGAATIAVRLLNVATACWARLSVK